MDNKSSKENHEDLGRVCVFCASCNVQVDATVVAHYDTTDMPDNVDIDDISEGTCFSHQAYKVAECTRCRSIFFVRENWHHHHLLTSQFLDQQVLYPALGDDGLEDVPAGVRGLYTEAMKSFRATSYRACVMMCRACVEEVCRNLVADLKAGEKTSGADQETVNMDKKIPQKLKQKIEYLVDESIIEPTIGEWAHELRGIGNDAAHGNGQPPDKNDAEDTLEFTHAILIYTFSMREKFAKFQERKNRIDSTAVEPSGNSSTDVAVS